MHAEAVPAGSRADRPDRRDRRDCPDRRDRFDGRAVVDWNDVAIGELARAQRDPRTMDLRSLTVRLNEDAQRRAGVRERELVIPSTMVAGIRADALELDRPVESLGRVGRCSA